MWKWLRSLDRAGRGICAAAERRSVSTNRFEQGLSVQQRSLLRTPLARRRCWFGPPDAAVAGAPC